MIRLGVDVIGAHNLSSAVITGSKTVFEVATISGVVGFVVMHAKHKGYGVSSTLSTTLIIDVIGKRNGGIRSNRW